MEKELAQYIQYAIDEAVLPPEFGDLPPVEAIGHVFAALQSLKMSESGAAQTHYRAMYGVFALIVGAIDTAPPLPVYPHR